MRDFKLESLTQWRESDEIHKQYLKKNERNQMDNVHASSKFWTRVTRVWVCVCGYGHEPTAFYVTCSLWWLPVVRIFGTNTLNTTLTLCLQDFRKKKASVFTKKCSKLVTWIACKKIDSTRFSGKNGKMNGEKKAVFRNSNWLGTKIFGSYDRRTFWNIT